MAQSTKNKALATVEILQNDSVQYDPNVHLTVLVL